MKELKKKLKNLKKDLDSIIGEYIGTYPKPFNYKRDVKKLENEIFEIHQQILQMEEEYKMVLIEQEIDYDVQTL